MTVQFVVTMKKLFLLALAIVAGGMFFSISAEAQVLLGLPYEKIHTLNRKPMPYQFVREADVMWSKIVWRQVELTERANQHLYYPTVPQDGRMSLIDVLLEGIHTQGLTAYIDSGSDEFGTILTEKEIHENLGTTITPQDIEDLEGNIHTEYIETKYSSKDVQSYLIKELWFFDKQRSVMEVRIIGICPIRYFYREGEDENGGTRQKKKIFWIYYPEARKILANAECFNIQNDASRLSYEDILEKRYFSSFIFQESNIYDNRGVSEYTTGEETLIEADRIKEKIFNFEQDLWEY